MRLVTFLCLLALAFAAFPPALAQVPAYAPLTFALPEHPGRLHFEGSRFEITELSAKSNFREFGIRAVEKSSAPDKLHFLGFLFLWPEAQPLSAASCRDRMLQELGTKNLTLPVKREFVTPSGVKIAVAEYTQTGQGSPESTYVSRAFLAEADLCADLEFSSARAPSPTKVDALLETITFEPAHAPDFNGQFFYAKVLEQHHALLAAAHSFELAAANTGSMADSLQWRRIATDQASLDYGMSGDLKRSREVNQTAIARDPDYPLYYYNLACADAESGDAIAARTHLQQAFDRRSHVLKGEKMPDPATDDSILKLKHDAQFWHFVQSLPKA